MTAPEARKDKIEALVALLAHRDLIMGVVNITPDSFSDGGLYFDRDHAVSHALQLIEDGADILDIGGESTRPGAESVSVQEQIDRIVPVIENIREVSQIPVSVDSSHTEVVRVSFGAGADIANDITALEDSPDLAQFVAEEEGALVLMHMRGTPQTMQTDTEYEDIIVETRSFLAVRAEQAVSAGLPRDHVWIDPGIGFGKSREGNLEILRRLGEYDVLGFRLLIGLSRKSFIGSTLGRELKERLAGTLSAIAYVASAGPHRIHRVHDVREVSDCLRMVHAIRNSG